MSRRHFDFLVSEGRPVGEVVFVNRYFITLRGLQPVNHNALVMFEDGSKGIVQYINEETVDVLHLGTNSLRVGMSAVVQHDELVCKVGSDFLGRVVSVTGEPLDGKGPIAADAAWPVFNEAPPMYGREELSDQLVTGITVIDSLFPIVQGQRLAILGDNKSGKSSISTHIAVNQKATDRVTIYVLIAKRRADVDGLLAALEKNDAMKSTVVVVSTIFESLVMSYLAPYVGCAMGEYFWQKAGRETIVIYDDLTNHAMVHREISLLSGVSPGRDSYPGDTFFIHSSLLERAGRISANHKTLTALPVITASSGDITAYLPTNIMSMTDGQWILDMEILHQGRKPAISLGLSVTRVGGNGHNRKQKDLASATLKLMASYRQAQEFSRFGSELSRETQQLLSQGKLIENILTQDPGDFVPLVAQQLMLDTVLASDGSIEAGKLRAEAVGMASVAEKSYDDARSTLFDKLGIKVTAEAAK